MTRRETCERQVIPADTYGAPLRTIYIFGIVQGFRRAPRNSVSQFATTITRFNDRPEHVTVLSRDTACNLTYRFAVDISLHEVGQAEERGTAKLHGRSAHVIYASNRSLIGCVLERGIHRSPLVPDLDGKCT